MTPQEIKPRHVNSEQAKLLKEKGFDIECKMCVEEGDERPLPFNCGNTIHKNSLHPYYSAPEQWQVVEWLRVKYGIWVVPDIKHTKGIGLHFGVDIWKLIPDVEVKYIPTNIPEDFLTPQEAYSDAFDYILNNLI